MSKLKHNDPCHCGSGKKYRNCHLQQDRAARDRVEASRPRPSAAPARAVRHPPRWIRGAAVGVSVVGLAIAVAVGSAFDTPQAVGVLVFTGIVVVALFVFGDPPPPRDDAGDPAGINFGRRR